MGELYRRPYVPRLIISSSKFILERPFAGVACSANAAVEYFVSVFNVAGVGLGIKSCSQHNEYGRNEVTLSDSLDGMLWTRSGEVKFSLGLPLPVS